MTKVWLSPAARADLVAIRDYSIEQFDPDTADAYFLGFDALFDLLSERPLVGPAKPDLGKGIRCMVHRRHRIFYQVEGDLVLILRILHHARDARMVLRGKMIGERWERKAREISSNEDIDLYYSIYDARSGGYNTVDRAALQRILDKYPDATSEHIEALDRWAAVMTR